MKREKLFDAITDIKDEILTRADARYTARQEQRRAAVRRWRRGAIAAVLAVAVLGGVVLHSFMGKERAVDTALIAKAYALEQAKYPAMTQYPDENSLTFESDHEAWWEDTKAQRGPSGYADDLDGFFAKTIVQFLGDAGEENRVYSPLNVYMALAMLAETTDGESRAQILELLNKNDMDSLREQASALWNANYRADGATTSLLASSLWLNEYLDYDADTVKTLSETYYASSYQGEMGSEKFDAALRDWLNTQTGGLLEEQVGNLFMSPDTVLMLATTVYYCAKWDSKFNADKNTTEIFHAPDGDVEAEFMHKSTDRTYYWGEHFTAASLNMENAGAMWFILPDEDVTVDDLLNDPETMEFILDKNDWENSKYLKVNLSLPKFDVTSQMDLKDGLRELGVTDVFDESAADFSALTDFEPVWLDKVQHDARVIIDEEGVEAAAYTAMVAVGGAAPPDEEVDLVLDRPFLFIITGLDGLPLFVGIVNNP